MLANIYIHPLEHKLNVVRTLLHRSEIVTDPEDRSEEFEQVKKALGNCDYKDWAFSRASNKGGGGGWRKPPRKKTRCPRREHQQLRCHVLKDPRKSCVGPSAFNTAGVPTAFKPYRTLRQTLVSSKHKCDKWKQSKTVYELSYLNCESVYIGETDRKLEKMVV